MLCSVATMMMGFNGKIRFLYQDETRLGLKTISGRKITAKGVKPRGKVQWQFKATYLYGVVDRKTGKNFFDEFSHLNSQCFQIFLDLVSQTFPDELLIIQLDNGGFHKAKKLKVPENMILMFQPPHCEGLSPESNSGACKPRPESNAIEQVWQYLKKGLRWKTTASLDELRELIRKRLEEMTKEVIASITGRSYVLEAISVVNF